MITSIAFLTFAIASMVVLSMMAVRERRSALKLRNGLFDSVAGLFKDPSITIGPDQFPVLAARLSDGRQIRMELIADTLVCRRLPQLWLKVTLRTQAECRRLSIGALARPTGAEFYSIVHGFPEWIEPPPTETALLMRGDSNATDWDIERAGAMFASLFSDPTMKEAAITPRGVRIIRQVAQGDRGTHLLLRQVRFPDHAISIDLVRAAIAKVKALSEVLRDEGVEPRRLSA